MDLIERVQYKAALIFSGCWQGISRDRLYEELVWESLSDRRWARRLTIFDKIKGGHVPLYLSDHIPKRNEISNRTANTPFIPTQRYENSFFLILSKNGKNEEAKYKFSVPSFKTFLNDFIKPSGHFLFGIREKFGINLLTKIRVSFSDLRDHNFFKRLENTNINKTYLHPCWNKSAMVKSNKNI